MGNALKTSLVGFQPHGAEKSPLGALTLGSEPPQGGIFKGENGVHWRPKKKFVTKTMDEKHNENMFFVFTTIFDPLGLPHPLLKARYFGFFEIFFWTTSLAALAECQSARRTYVSVSTFF